MERKKAAVLGASGYTGGELIRFLLAHPKVRVTHITAQTHAGKRIDEIFPHLTGIFDLTLDPLQPETLPGDVEIVFAALPHGASANIVKELFARDVRIVDLGADFRLSYRAYQKWYGEHPCPELIEQAAYGITELNRTKIKEAKLVANPGCYPESAILGLAPVLASETAEEDSIIIDSKSGVSGAGRSPRLDYHFCEVNEGIRAYKIGEHRHAPEIEEALGNFTGLPVNVSFTPHLIPMDRGILSTIYVKLKRDITTGDLLEIYMDFYSGERFVRVMPEGVYPSTAQVRGSNFCDIGMRVNPNNRTAVIVSVLDNLVKGAAGQAVQNMNVMMGFEESLALEIPPVFP